MAISEASIPQSLTAQVDNVTLTTSGGKAQVNIGVTASDTAVITNATERSASDDTSYTKLKELTITNIPASNSVRIKFDGKHTGAGSGNMKLYKNGVAVGTEQTTTGTYQTFSEDFTDEFVNGDTIQVYYKVSAGGNNGFCRNLKICGTATPTSSLGAWYDSDAL